VFDLKANIHSDIRSYLRPYSTEINLKLIRSSFGQTDFLMRAPEAELQRIASLPEASTCSE
jgi:hypothetical protein